MVKKIEKIKEILSPSQAALVTSENNRFYLSGFHSSAGAVLITKTNQYLFADFRYFEKARKTVSHLNVILTERLFTQINGILSENGIKSLLIENENVSLKEYRSYKNNLTSVTVEDSGLLSEKLCDLRAVKDPEEVSSIRAAQKLTDDTFSHILSFIKAGRTERETALEMEFYMRKQGSEGASFDFIAVSGKNSSLPHGVPTDKPIESGDFLTLDFGAVVNGYRSDMTRTVAVGDVTEKQKTVYNTVLKAQTEALKRIKAGAKCLDVDKVARDIIDGAGFKGCFGHGLGHSVGLEIHETPCLNTRDETLLKSGVIMTVEPGIYLENEFGVRIEDMVLVTETGYENFTQSDKSLIIL